MGGFGGGLQTSASDSYSSNWPVAEHKTEGLRRGICRGESLGPDSQK